MNVLLTGVGGFIGSHCLKYFLKKTDWNIVGIDSFEHKGIPIRLTDFVFNDLSKQEYNRIKILKHDLTVPIPNPLIRQIGDVDLIVNMASDSAVERSGENPISCLKNNYHLMINMLEYARICKPKIFFQISTDEVYGEAKPNQNHVEWDKIVPSNPYSASKAAQENIAVSYWRCFDVPIVITNTVNNFGEAQDVEKFFPKVMQSLMLNKIIPIYGDQQDSNVGTRFYLYADNHADVLVFLSQFEPTKYNKGKHQLPDRYNVIGGPELTNLELAKKIAKFMNKELLYEIVSCETARKGYDKRYALNGSKLKNMGWLPPINFEHGVKQTIQWSLKNKHWIN